MTEWEWARVDDWLRDVHNHLVHLIDEGLELQWSYSETVRLRVREELDRLRFLKRKIARQVEIL